MQSHHDARTVIVVKSLTVPSLLQIENVSLEAASTRAPQPSTILKFDVFNDSPSRLTDVVMNVSFVEKQLPERFTTPARVLVGPVTIRVAEILQAGYTLRYEMLFRNLSSDWIAPRASRFSRLVYCLTDSRARDALAFPRRVVTPL